VTVSERASSPSQPAHAPTLPALMPSISDFYISLSTRRGAMDDVRREAARYALEAMTAHEPVDSWIVDDTGFLKQGRHSVGVQRQYTGSAGKTTNCQNRRQFDGDDPHRAAPDRLCLVPPRDLDGRSSASTRSPNSDDVQFATKTELALRLLQRAVDNGSSRVWSSRIRPTEQRASFARAFATWGWTTLSPSTIGQSSWCSTSSAGGRDEIISIHRPSHIASTHGGFRRCSTGVRAPSRIYRPDSHSGASSLRTTGRTASRSARRCGC